MQSTRCSARPTERSSWARSSTPPAPAWQSPSSSVQAERRGELGVPGQLLTQPLEVADQHRHRAAPYEAVRPCGIREPDEPLPRLCLQELDVCGERPRARRLLPDNDLVEQLRLSPWCRLLARHAATVAAKPSRVCARCVTKA